MEPLKKLEELGISPSPWRHTDDGMGYRDIKCECHLPSDDYEGEDIIAELVEEKDADMMIASTDMYDALWDLLFGNTGTTNCRNCKGHELGNCGGCHLGKAIAALEKAGGGK